MLLCSSPFFALGKITFLKGRTGSPMQTDFFGALVDGSRKSETLSLFLLPFCDFVREARKKEYDTCRSNFRLAYNYFKFILLAFSNFFD